MIAKKVFNADGTNKRFLSDFIIQSEQFTRVYAYIYDVTLPADGTGDKLQDGTTDPANWSFPTNIWKRGADAPKSEDLVTIDKWDLVSNSILMYSAPLAPTKIWVEVATTPEEFGDTITQPSVERAEVAADIAVANAALTSADVVTTHADVVLTHADVALTHADVLLTNADVASTHADVVLTNADVVTTHADVLLTNADVALTHADVLLTNADVASTHADVLFTNADVVTTQLKVWEAEAEQLTANSYAVEPEDVFVKVYTSNGDGTFTATPTTDYSALHHQTKGLAQDASTKLPKDGSEPMTGTLVAPSITSLDGGTDGIKLNTTATDLDYLGIRFEKQNVQKWLNYVDNTAISDLFWQRRKDDGTLTTVMKMIRDTAQVDFSFMPTVAGDKIEEKGSNANGTWVKFADGTAIATTILTGTQTVSASGVGYAKTNIGPFALPITFTSVNHASVETSSHVTGYCWASVAGVTTTTIHLNLFSFTNGANAKLKAMIVGTWK